MLLPINMRPNGYYLRILNWFLLSSGWLAQLLGIRFLTIQPLQPWPAYLVLTAVLLGVSEIPIATHLALTTDLQLVLLAQICLLGLFPVTFTAPIWINNAGWLGTLVSLIGLRSVSAPPDILLGLMVWIKEPPVFRPVPHRTNYESFNLHSGRILVPLGLLLQMTALAGLSVQAPVSLIGLLSWLGLVPLLEP